MVHLAQAFCHHGHDLQRERRVLLHEECELSVIDRGDAGPRLGARGGTSRGGVYERDLALDDREHRVSGFAFPEQNVA